MIIMIITIITATSHSYHNSATDKMKDYTLKILYYWKMTSKSHKEILSFIPDQLGNTKYSRPTILQNFERKLLINIPLWLRWLSQHISYYTVIQFVFVPHGPLCFIVTSIPAAQLSAFSLHSLSYVLPFVPHTGSFTSGQSSMRGQRQTVDPSGITPQTEWNIQWDALHGSTRNLIKKSNQQAFPLTFEMFHSIKS